MKITRLKIENFRSVRSLELNLGDTTIFIGQNNAGKSAILEAVRIVLTRRWGQRGTGFTEHDVHKPGDGRGDHVWVTRISHQWLRKMVAYRIADPTILS